MSFESLEKCTTIFNPARVKILDGIAGSGKSSKLDAIMRAAGVEYSRFTSTNKLKRDALDRFGGHCDTIAGGLFHTEDGTFFASQKDDVAGTVVIDEVLQTDRRVLDWVRENRGKCNIFLLTDTRQMLAPRGGQTFLELFNRFKLEPFADVIDMPNTLRARDAKTADIYRRCYDSVATDNSLYYQMRDRIPHIAFSDLMYNAGDVYITHTNNDERAIYDRFSLSNRYELDLIPKGTIARKPPKDPEKYPIIPQCDVKARLYGYYQVANVGTPTRYQGSECTEQQTLYYIVQPGARVEAREWYTVVTRSYLFDNIRIVDAPRTESNEFKVYFDKPIKETAWPDVSRETRVPDVGTVGEIVGEDKRPRIDKTYIQAATADIKDTPETHFRDSGFLLDGRLVLPTREDDSPAPVSMSGLLSKEPCFSYKFMPNFYRRYEYIQREIWGETFSYFPTSATIKTRQPNAARGDFMFGLDLCASYPHILANYKLPVDGTFFTDDSNDAIQQGAGPDLYSFATVVGSSFIPDGAIISAETVIELQEIDAGAKCLWIGTSKAKRGSLMGRRLLDMSQDTAESNTARKSCRYGLAERAYLDGCEWDGKGEPLAFFIEENQNHAPLMWAVKDAQARAMLLIYKEIYSDFINCGLTIADAIYFNYYKDIQKLGNRIRKILPDLDFRIFKTGEADKAGDILYKTYADPPTRAEKKKQQAAARWKRYSAKLAQNCTEC